MIVRLYAEHHNWSAVKEKWHEERIHERVPEAAHRRFSGS